MITTWLVERAINSAFKLINTLEEHEALLASGVVDLQVELDKKKKLLRRLQIVRDALADVFHKDNSDV